MVPTLDDIRAHLPHAAPRHNQLETIQTVFRLFDEGKRVVMLEAATGAGKSAIGLTVARFFQSSFYLTIQKILQSQISQDYGRSDLVELKGRNAYPCTFWKRDGRRMIERGLITRAAGEREIATERGCDAGYCYSQGRYKCARCFLKPEHENGVPGGDLDRLPDGMVYSACPYYEQVEQAVHAPHVLMNFSSFLYQTQYTGRFDSRELLVVDECHHTEGQLMDFVTVSISDLHLQKRGIQLPQLDDPREYVVWYQDFQIDKEFLALMQEARDNGDLKMAEDYYRIYKKFKKFMASVCKPGEEDKELCDWVCDFTETKTGSPPVRTVTMRPVYVHDYADDLILGYGRKVLMMSATILDPNIMCRCLGLRPDEVGFIRLPSQFPVRRRPIYVTPVAAMSGGASKMQEWGPALVKAVDAIVARYSGKRGIVHTHNFAIAKMIMNQCKCRGRFLYQENFPNKDEMLAAHARAADSVLVAPAMHEGLDLRDDLSRFQIICKTPYPNFFDDQQLARRVDDDRSYLIWLTALKLVQSAGRSVRSATDWADTYILDGNIDRFIRDARSILPTWFLEALIWP